MNRLTANTYRRLRERLGATLNQEVGFVLFSFSFRAWRVGGAKLRVHVMCRVFLLGWPWRGEVAVQFSRPLCQAQDVSVSEDNSVGGLLRCQPEKAVSGDVPQSWCSLDWSRSRAKRLCAVELCTRRLRQSSSSPLWEAEEPGWGGLH